MVLGLVLTYKLFTVEESDIRKFMKSFRMPKHDTKTAEDPEFAGYEIRELTDLWKGYLESEKLKRNPPA